MGWLNDERTKIAQWPYVEARENMKGRERMTVGEMERERETEERMVGRLEGWLVGGRWQKWRLPLTAGREGSREGEIVPLYLCH